MELINACELRIFDRFRGDSATSSVVWIRKNRSTRVFYATIIFFPLNCLKFVYKRLRISHHAEQAGAFVDWVPGRPQHSSRPIEIMCIRGFK